MGALLSEAPVFSMPLLNFVANAVINKICQRLVNSAELGAFFLYTDFRVSQAGNEFFQAAQKYNWAKTNGTAFDKIKTEKEFIEKARKLMVLNS